MAKYRKKPVVVDAEQFNETEWPLPFRNDLACRYYGGYWYVVNAHGQEIKIVDGDWIIREPDGRGFYPCKPDIFQSTYYGPVENEE